MQAIRSSVAASSQARANGLGAKGNADQDQGFALLMADLGAPPAQVDPNASKQPLNDGADELASEADDAAAEERRRLEAAAQQVMAPVAVAPVAVAPAASDVSPVNEQAVAALPLDSSPVGAVEVLAQPTSPSAMTLPLQAQQLSVQGKTQQVDAAPSNVPEIATAAVSQRESLTLPKTGRASVLAQGLQATASNQDAPADVPTVGMQLDLRARGASLSSQRTSPALKVPFNLGVSAGLAPQQQGLSPVSQAAVSAGNLFHVEQAALPELATQLGVSPAPLAVGQSGPSLLEELKGWGRVTRAAQDDTNAPSLSGEAVTSRGRASQGFIFESGTDALGDAPRAATRIQATDAERDLAASAQAGVASSAAVALPAASEAGIVTQTAPVPLPSMVNEVVRVAGELAQAQKQGKPEGTRVVEMRLDPPALGSLHVRVVEEKGLVHAYVTVANPAMQKVVAAEMSHLSTSLAHHGIALGQVSVGTQDGGSRDFGRRPDEPETPARAGAPRRGVAATGPATPTAVIERITGMGRAVNFQA